MGTWSEQPVGNDAAADWVEELRDQDDWSAVEEALSDVLGEGSDAGVDADVAEIAIAAAECVAHGLGRPTQEDGYTTAIAAFVSRVPAPGAGLVALAGDALDAVTSDGSELVELWADAGPDAWLAAVARVREALGR